ncbi:hypothetical protein TCAL_10970 [Tigriopus californicus]|uniref:CEP170 C-terminal domain-containing protein n=1 Tax=Tigriopus californicus TaxID=6832 RepID=A0A553NBS2_TIGCA|nr:hypothetical protein TCAL_10970 [Tigriopus californicus]
MEREPAHKPTHESDALPLAFTVTFGDDKNQKLDLRGGLQQFAPNKKLANRNLSAKSKRVTVPPVAVVNEQHTEDAPKFVAKARTYTIGEDEPVVQDDRANIGAVFGVSGSALTNEEKILQWASGSSASATPTPSCSSNSQVSGRRDSPTLDKDDASRSRRRLPPTPGLTNGSEKRVISPNSSKINPSRSDVKYRSPPDSTLFRRDTPETTDTFLADTMSVMVAMEARIEQCGDSMTRSRQGPSEGSLEKVNPDFRRNDRMFQDHSERQFRSIRSEDTASDSCCSSTTDASRQFSPHNFDDKGSKNSSPRSTSNSTRTNRAFALRRKMNSAKGSIPANVQPTPSLQGKTSPFDTHSRSRQYPKAKAFLPLRSQKKPAITETRSSSSLSAREANFQAWKRRQSYKPNFNVGNFNKPTQTSTMAEQGCSRKDERREGNSLTVSSDVKGMPVMTRSASFHYPDGLSRRQNNVYTSEDESDDSLAAEALWSGRNLLEVTEDEFFLPIEDKSSNQMGIRSKRSHSSTPLETLDNIVISTIFSVSAKLCLNTSSIIRKMKAQVDPLEEDHVVLDTLLYVLEDVDLPASPSKRVSRELAGTLKNLKKVEQALALVENLTLDTEESVLESNS